ncbi:DUF2525 domain-containing protein [Salmonella enterica subsp. enterica serovar Weltevreden]|nr:DUF2525 domain-containing protein [Salmonella enterica subsp. enterica serovar Weltevreden]
MKSAKARFTSREDPERVKGRRTGISHAGELAEAFELDIRDFSVTEVNR